MVTKNDSSKTATPAPTASTPAPTAPIPVNARQWPQGSRLRFVMYHLAQPAGLTFNKAPGGYLAVFGGTPTNGKQICNDSRHRGWAVKAHAVGAGPGKVYVYRGAPQPGATHPIPPTPFFAGCGPNGMVMAPTAPAPTAPASK